MRKKLPQLQQELADLKEAFATTLTLNNKVELYETLDDIRLKVWRLDPSTSRNFLLSAVAGGIGTIVPFAAAIAGAGEVVLLGSLGVTGVLIGKSVWMDKNYVPKDHRAFENERLAFYGEIGDAKKKLVDHVLDMAASPGFDGLMARDGAIKKAFEKACSAAHLQKISQEAKSIPSAPTPKKGLEL